MSRAMWTEAMVAQFSTDELVREFEARVRWNHYDPHGKDNGYYEEEELLRTEMIRRLNLPSVLSNSEL